MLLVEYESAILEEDIDHASAVVVNLFFSSHVQIFLVLHPPPQKVISLPYSCFSLAGSILAADV